jgi:hypothetical protein
MTIARSLSTNALTYSTIAFETGHMTMNSPRHSMTQMAVSPTKATDTKSPAGPDVFNISPFVEKTVTPITPPIAIICALGQKMFAGLGWGGRASQEPAMLAARAYKLCW